MYFDSVVTITRATLLLMIAASSASAALPGFTLAAQTARFSFYTRGSSVDAEKSERYLTKLEQVFGQRFNGRAEYYRYGSLAEVAVATGFYAEGATFAHQREVHSAHGFHAHEIVHLIAGQIGDPGALFHEGLAVVLGNHERWNGSDVDTLAKKALHRRPALELLEEFESADPHVGYPVAASFVRSLIKKHGLPKVIDFFRACPRPEGRYAAFERTFGIAYAQAAGEWSSALLRR